MTSIEQPNEQNIMNVNVHSIHFDADTKLVAFINEKLDKLTVFHDSIIGAEVFLRLEHDGEHRENKHVEIKLSVPGPDLFAKRKGKTFEEALSSTIEALRGQIEHNKNTLRKAS